MSCCPEFEARLNDLLDGELSPAERAEAERHLEGCAGCREELAALRSLGERTASLPRDLEPPADLWPEIRRALPARRPGTIRPVPGFPSWILGWGGLVPAAASVVLVIVLAVALTTTLRRGEVAPGGSGSIAPAPAPVVPAAAAPAGAPERESLASAEAEYRAATEKLLAALRREPGGASPEGVRVIEENLRIVDAAIAEIRRAAEEHPGRTVDSRVVTGLYRTRFELLQQAVRLASQGGEEKKS